MKLSSRCAVVIMCASLLALAGCVMAFPSAEGRFDRTLTVTGPVDLEVTTGSGKIEIRSGAASVVKVYGLVRARDDWRNNAQEKVRYLTSNPPVEQTGNVIRIGPISDEAYRNNVSISYEIEVPEETEVRSRTGSGGIGIEDLRGPVEARTGSGSISVSRVRGDISAETGSGGIHLDDVGGKVAARTGSGSIRAERITGSVQASTGSGGIHVELVAVESGGRRDVDVSTGSGSIGVMGVNGALRARSGSGGITADGNPGGAWEIHTSSGSVSLRIGADAAFDLNAHCGSGSIRVDHPVTMTGTAGKHDLRGTVRGGGPLVDVRTSSGGITIR